jgi:hypothetical protein
MQLVEEYGLIGGLGVLFIFITDVLICSSIHKATTFWEISRSRFIFQ